MGAVSDAIKSLKLWQIGVLVAVLVGTAGGTYGVYAWVSGPGQEDLGEDQQIIPVQRGDLVKQVSVSGSLVFPDRETLAFGSQGTVEEVLVEEGQTVEGGEPLARLDAATVASLEREVAQTRIDLQNAEDALEKAKDPHTALDMAQAEANAANAGLTLQDAQEALALLLEPTSQDVAQAEARAAEARLAVESAQEALALLLEPASQDIAQAEARDAEARLAVESAEEALALLLEPTSQDVAQAEARVTEARLAVQNASEALDAVEAGPTQDDIARAESNVDSATTTLANALRDLDLARMEWDGRSQAAQEPLDAALEAYQDVFQRWLGIDVTEEDAALDPDTLLGSWNADLDTLFDAEAGGQDIGFTVDIEGPPPDDPATMWSETVVYAWLSFYPGTLLATCEETEIDPGDSCVRKEMDDAWEAYQETKEGLDTVEIQAEKSIANAENAVARAEESLADAQEALDELKEGFDPLEVERSESQLELALADL